MRFSSCSPLDRMLRTQRCCFSVKPGAGQQHVAEAEDAVERRAQLVAHGGQEVALEAVRFVQGHVGLGQLVHLAVEVGVDLAQPVLHADQVAEHAVEGVAQVLELVAGLDLAAHVQLAGRDGVADLLQVLDRLDDDVADDEVAAGHDEQGRHQGGGDEDGPVDVDLIVDRLDGHGDLDDGDQIVFLQVGVGLAMAGKTTLRGPHGTVVVIVPFGEDKVIVFLSLFLVNSRNAS